MKKYIMKFEPKKNEIGDIQFRIGHNYREFDTIGGIIDFVTTNSLYLERVEVMQVVPLEGSKCKETINVSIPDVLSGITC